MEAMTAAVAFLIVLVELWYWLVEVVGKAFA